ncbi:type IV pilus modification protein PilV [Herbaspirillum sp. YR522]|uniref:type IV pilus modification protein PilV n=1 Tax=Herbaspirillum sp. YR522 TaxID=1144342 RepID=UPI00026F7F0C|nr:type IV pilus modification protein PilV [Herbaspirillum sp. YR522]EJN10045.1 type IV pilus modification protein PilV [Herbaspirillum sp. YR522]
MIRRSPGFTMIEVLVSMLVLGTGAMAMIMLQLQALRSSRDNALQSRAVMMAVELAELRSEYRAAGSPGEDPYLLEFEAGGNAPGQGDCSNVRCAPQTFAREAIAGWLTRLSNDFPDARVAVCRDSRAPATVAGDWACTAGGTGPVYIKLGWRGAPRFDTGGAPVERPQLAMFIGY